MAEQLNDHATDPLEQFLQAVTARLPGHVLAVSIDTDTGPPALIALPGDPRLKIGDQIARAEITADGTTTLRRYQIIVTPESEVPA